MLATQLNPMIHNKQLEQFTIIKVKKHICNQVGQQTKKVVVILEVEILTPGSEVGAKLGNPVPCVVLPALKVEEMMNIEEEMMNRSRRGAAGPGGVDQPLVKTVPGQVGLNLLLWFSF